MIGVESSNIRIGVRDETKSKPEILFARWFGRKQEKIDCSQISEKNDPPRDPQAPRTRASTRGVAGN